MDVRDAYHVCRYLIFVERIGDARLVYEEVAVREDLVHAKETDIFQFLGANIGRSDRQAKQNFFE